MTQTQKQPGGQDGPRTAEVAERTARRIAGRSTPTIGLAVLILLQLLCAVFFAGDAMADIIDFGAQAFTNWHIVVECMASAALFVAIAVQVRVLLHMVTRQKRLALAVTAAAGGLHDLVEAYFDDWALTASERDVAWLTLKGLSISEVAAVRGSAEGTVKAHLNGVYRKAGLNGRNALLSLLIEDLMAGDLTPADRPGSDARPDPRPDAGPDARPAADPAG